MVISNISLTKDTEFVTLSAEIAFRNKTPQQAYFKVLRNYETFVCDDATPFLAAFLVPCMKTRENIYIDDTVSALFLKNTNHIMSLLKKANPDLYKIRIRSKKTIKNNYKSTNAGTFFEADVNTFFTYLKENSGKKAITHLLAAQGFSDYLVNKDYAEEKEVIIKKIAKERKIEAVFVDSNIGTLIDERLHWNFVYPGALESVALFLNRDFKKILITPTAQNNQPIRLNIPDNFSVVWSTESLTVQQVTDDLNYIEKINRQISKSSLALKYLYVCGQKGKKMINCGHCYNCLIAKLSLYLSGTLKKSKTFEKTIDLEQIKKMNINYKKKENILLEKILELFIANNMDTELQVALLYSLEKNKRHGVMKGFYPKVKSLLKNYSVHSKKLLPKSSTHELSQVTKLATDLHTKKI